MRDTDFEVFHAGERAAQQHAGAREKLAELGPRVIRNHMPDQHRQFFTLLPWLLIGSTDQSGQPWASVVTGSPGFVTSPDAHHLAIRTQPLPADPLRQNLHTGAAVGILGLQSHTRRRNRMNGVVEHFAEGELSVRVQQSFGNCPKYIQAREATFIEGQTPPVVSEHLDYLDAAAIESISGADTFLIATAHPAVVVPDDELQCAEGVDISHRGGTPGFIRVADNVLTVPDYTGNFFFNTLGNLLLEPRAGLLFIDFSNNDLLQISVKAVVIWESPVLSEFPGAQRLLRMEVTGMIRHRRALPLIWSDAVMSPYLF